MNNKKEIIGGIYTDVSERFQRGVLKDLSRALKANCHDAGVVEINRLGNIYGEDKGTGYAGNVWDKEGLCPTLTTMGGGNREPMIVEDFYKNREPRVYDETAPTIRAEREGLKVIEEKIIIGSLQKNAAIKTDGICTTLTEAMGKGGGQTPMIVASRGRNPDNPSDRKQGIELEQRLEPNSEGICNTLTSVQKDNLVLEPAILTPKRTEYGKAVRKDYENGKIQESRHNMTELQPRNDGISNTLTTVQKDNLLLTPNNWKHKAGDGTKTRSRRISEIHPALQANTGASQQTYLAETPYRIRKLTPKECALLMKFTEEDAEKMLEVNSNTQVLKQCGNSIVVSVLEAIFCQMNIKGCPTWEEQSKKYE